MEWLAQVLNFIMEPCYQLTGNWWIAILLFTVIVKIILLPMSLWCQKNSIVMVQLMPALNRIKVKYFGDREAIGDKQNELFKERHYHPLLSLVPLAVQILILFGLVDVIHGITDYGAPGTELLGMVPATDGGIAWFMPLAAGLSAIVMGFAQNRINPLQKEQSRAEKNTTNGLSIGLSFILGIFVATGMGFYWVCSNLMSIAIQAICNLIIVPRKHIDYKELEASRAELEELEALDASDRKWYQRDPLAKREKADYKRFFNVVNKHIVFYSESSGFYKYFQGAIEWLLANSDATIHYVTNDPDDQIFRIAEEQPRIRPYYIGPKRIITLMMKMDAQMVATTLEDLDNYYIKRSYVCDDTEYVFFFHHMTSTHMTPNKGAYDGYDTIMCSGQHQIDEMRRAEELYGTPAKTLVPYGYDLLDRTIESYKRLSDGGKRKNDQPTVIIAPSWQESCILDTCIDELIESLSGNGYRIIVRPHPEYTKRYRPRWEAILARYADKPEEELRFENDFSSNESVFTSDILITDWSTVAHEFSFSTNKPSIFIDTPMKVNNPDYEELGIVPTDISLRNEIGVSLPLDGLDRLSETVAEMLDHQEAWRDRIAETTERCVFNLGHSAEVAGEFLLARLLEKQSAGKREENSLGSGGNDAGPDRAEQSSPRRRRDGKDLAKTAASYLPEAVVAAMIALPFMTQPAYAYVDPSVMTYTIQALAGVAVALSAVLGVVFRKTRRKIFAMLKIDENAHKEVEGDIHRVVDGKPVAAYEGEDIAQSQSARTRAGKDSASEHSANRAPSRQNPANRLRWRARIGYALIASVFLFYTLFVVAPIEIVASNASSLTVGIEDVGWYMVAFAGASAVVCALLMSLFRGRAFTVALLSVTAIAIGCYVQAMFMNQGLPTADGSSVPWHDYSAVTFSTALVWIALIVGLVVVSRRFARQTRAIAVAASIALIVVQSIGVASLLVDPAVLTGGKEENEPIDCTEDGLFELSPKSNVVVFVLDTYDTIDLKNVLEIEPDLLQPFEDFTFFENSTGSMIPTRYAVPFLLTDVTPKVGETYDDYYADRYGNATFLSDVYDADYSIGLYSDSLGMDYTIPSEKEVASQTVNLHPTNTKHVNVSGSVAILAKASLYRDMPWLLKPQFWFYTDEMNREMVSIVDGDDDANSLFRADDAAYYKKLKEKKLGLTDDGKAGAFRFIHLVGAHYPYTLDRNGNDVGEGNTSFTDQAIGSMKIVNEYLDQMKELGVYDSSTIIVTADHGYWYITPDMIWDTTSPIMLVKPANETGERSPLAMSDAPVSHMDFQPTVIEAVGGESDKYGDTIFEIDDLDRKRLYYMTTSNGKHDTGIREIEIDGDALDFDNWKLTGNDWPIIPPED